MNDGRCLPISLVLVLLLTGCVVGPDYEKQEPENLGPWSESATVAVSEEVGHLASWWTMLEDTVLDALIEHAIADNPDRDLALARVRESRARYRGTRAERWPVASGTAGSNRTESTDPLGSKAWRSGYDLGIDASWEADIFGGTRRSAEAARATLESRDAEYIDVMTSLVAEVALTYLDYRSLEERLRVNRMSLAAQQRSFDLARWRHKAGLVTALDLEQSRANLESTRAGIPQLERDLGIARNKLTALTGQSRNQLDALLAPAGGIPRQTRNIAIVVPGEALRQRGDVRAAERNLARQMARVGVAEAARYPVLSLSGALATSAPETSNLFDSASTVTSLGFGLAAPIFNAGRLRANVDVEDALYDQALASYEKTVRNAVRETEDALASHEAAVRRVVPLERAVAAAVRASELARLEYEAGLTGFDRVLDSEQTQLSLEEQRLLNQSAETQALIRLYKAVGGGWDAALTEH